MHGVTTEARRGHQTLEMEIKIVVNTGPLNFLAISQDCLSLSEYFVIAEDMKLEYLL